MDLYSNARQRLGKSSVEYTDPSTAKTGKNKKLSHGKSKGKKILYSIAQVTLIVMKGTQNAYDLIVKIYVSYTGQWSYVKNICQPSSVYQTLTPALFRRESVKKTPNPTPKIRRKQNSTVNTRT